VADKSKFEVIDARHGNIWPPHPLLANAKRGFFRKNGRVVQEMQKFISKILKKRK